MVTLQELEIHHHHPGNSALTPDIKAKPLQSRIPVTIADKETSLMGTLFGILVFGGFTVAILISYRLFMRGDTAEEKVAALLPPDFKPDVFHRKGDTYVGYEKNRNRLVVVDWPHAKVLSPGEVVSLEPVQESTLGITHHWVAVNVPDALFPQYRIWFQFRRAQRDVWLGQLAEICGK